MIRKLSQIILMLMALLITGCIKETYNMDKLSSKVYLSPTLKISAVNGGFKLSDLVESGDTIVFDEDNFIRVVFSEDSILDLKMADFYDLNNMVTFNQSYTIGELNLDPFFKTFNLSLRVISTHFSAPLAAQFAALDNTTNIFPPFPLTNLGEYTFSAITNFENAVFASGFIEISILNNLAAPLNGVNIQLYNNVGHTPIGPQATISLIAPGNLGLTAIDLTDQTVTNSIIASIEIAGSPGTSTPVFIDLDVSNIEAGIRGKDLVVKSGRVILPLQTLDALAQKDTITFDPGIDIEIDEFKILTGNFSYTLISSSPVSASVDITLPTALRAGVPINEIISVPPNSTLNNDISMDNTIIDLGTDPLQPFNRVPMEYSIEVGSGNTLVDFDMNDEISIDFMLIDPDFDYVKGYFGQQTESIDPDSIDLEIEDFLMNISGDFLVSSPSIKLTYSNSFAIPMEINLAATGSRGINTVNLGLAPVTIDIPAAPAERDITSVFAIDKNNSDLPELISLPPEKIVFSGSAKMNPSGNDGFRNNYVFGNSRLIGTLEVEVPMEFRMNNLQFTDTVDNFLKDDNSNDNSSIKAEDFSLLRVDITANNGFPVGISVKMSLYDSLTSTIKSTVDGTGIIEPAPVDSNGKVTTMIESKTTIELTTDFFSAITNADKIIFQFTLNTTDNGTKDVKIYSDYTLDFNAALVVKPEIDIYLK